MYKLAQPNRNGDTVMVQRISDNAYIPFDPMNSDYQAYLKFLADGNTPLPAEENT